jgi:hypothetical protein
MASAASKLTMSDLMRIKDFLLDDRVPPEILEALQRDMAETLAQQNVRNYGETLIMKDDVVKDSRLKQVLDSLPVDFPHAREVRVLIASDGTGRLIVDGADSGLVLSREDLAAGKFLNGPSSVPLPHERREYERYLGNNPSVMTLVNVLDAYERAVKEAVSVMDATIMDRDIDSRSVMCVLVEKFKDILYKRLESEAETDQ